MEVKGGVLIRLEYTGHTEYLKRPCWLGGKTHWSKKTSNCYYGGNSCDSMGKATQRERDREQHLFFFRFTGFTEGPLLMTEVQQQQENSALCGQATAKQFADTAAQPAYSAMTRCCCGDGPHRHLCAPSLTTLRGASIHPGLDWFWTLLGKKQETPTTRSYVVGCAERMSRATLEWTAMHRLCLGALKRSPAGAVTGLLYHQHSWWLWHGVVRCHCSCRRRALHLHREGRRWCDPGPAAGTARGPVRHCVALFAAAWATHHCSDHPSMPVCWILLLLSSPRLGCWWRWPSAGAFASRGCQWIAAGPPSPTAIAPCCSDPMCRCQLASRKHQLGQ